MMIPFPRMALGRSGQARVLKLFPGDFRKASQPSQRAAFVRVLQIADFVRDYSGGRKTSSEPISATRRRPSNIDNAYGNLLCHSRVPRLHTEETNHRSRLVLSPISSRLGTRCFSTRRFSTSGQPPDSTKNTTTDPQGPQHSQRKDSNVKNQIAEGASESDKNPDGILERLKKRVMRRSFLGKAILVVMLFRMSTTLEYYLLEAEASLYDTLKMFEVAYQQLRQLEKESGLALFPKAYGSGQNQYPLLLNLAMLIRAEQTYGEESRKKVEKRARERLELEKLERREAEEDEREERRVKELNIMRERLDESDGSDTSSTESSHFVEKPLSLDSAAHYASCSLVAYPLDFLVALGVVSPKDLPTIENARSGNNVEGSNADGNNLNAKGLAANGDPAPKVRVADRLKEERERTRNRIQNHNIADADDDDDSDISFSPRSSAGISSSPAHIEISSQITLMKEIHQTAEETARELKRLEERLQKLRETKEKLSENLSRRIHILMNDLGGKHAEESDSPADEITEGEKSTVPNISDAGSSISSTSSNNNGIRDGSHKRSIRRTITGIRKHIAPQSEPDEEFVKIRTFASRRDRYDLRGTDDDDDDDDFDDDDDDGYHTNDNTNRFSNFGPQAAPPNFQSDDDSDNFQGDYQPNPDDSTDLAFSRQPSRREDEFINEVCQETIRKHTRLSSVVVDYLFGWEEQQGTVAKLAEIKRKNSTFGGKRKDSDGKDNGDGKEHGNGVNSVGDAAEDSQHTTSDSDVASAASDSDTFGQQSQAPRGRLEKIFSIIGRLRQRSYGLFCPDAGKVFHPGFYIAVDTENKAVVISIRGTSDINDALTDLFADEEEVKVLGNEEDVEGGMARASNGEIGETVDDFARRGSVIQMGVGGKAYERNTKQAASSSGHQTVETPSDSSPRQKKTHQEHNKSITIVAHGGILRAAKFVADAAKPRVRELLDQTGFNKVVVTGHSLGAGTAQLVGQILAVEEQEDPIFVMGGVSQSFWQRKFSGFARNLRRAETQRRTSESVSQRIGDGPEVGPFDKIKGALGMGPGSADGSVNTADTAPPLDPEDPNGERTLHIEVYAYGPPPTVSYRNYRNRGIADVMDAQAASFFSGKNMEQEISAQMGREAPISDSISGVAADDNHDIDTTITTSDRPGSEKQELSQTKLGDNFHRMGDVLKENEQLLEDTKDKIQNQLDEMQDYLEAKVDLSKTLSKALSLDLDEEGDDDDSSYDFGGRLSLFGRRHRPVRLDNYVFCKDHDVVTHLSVGNVLRCFVALKYIDTLDWSFWKRVRYLSEPDRFEVDLSQRQTVQLTKRQEDKILIHPKNIHRLSSGKILTAAPECYYRLDDALDGGSSRSSSRASSSSSSASASQAGANGFRRERRFLDDDNDSLNRQSQPASARNPTDDDDGNGRWDAGDEKYYGNTYRHNSGPLYIGSPVYKRWGRRNMASKFVITPMPGDVGHVPIPLGYPHLFLNHIPTFYDVAVRRAVWAKGMSAQMEGGGPREAGG